MVLHGLSKIKHIMLNNTPDKQQTRRGPGLLVQQGSEANAIILPIGIQSVKRFPIY